MPAYAPRPAAFGAAAGGPVGQGQVSLEPPEAFAAALQAIAASGGQLTWQSAPNAARFNMVKKSFLTTGGLAVNYAGDLQVQRTGPSQSTVAMSLKINWNNYIPIALTSVIAMVLFLMWNPGFGMLMILLMGASIGYSAWQLSSQVPELFLRTILGHLNVSPIGAPAGAPAAVSPLQGAPPTPVTVLPGAAPAPAPPAPQAPPGTRYVVQQIGRSGDHGVGRYQGLTKLDVGDSANEFLCIEYAKNDKLYVPVENLDVLSRYGGEIDGVALDKLGGIGESSWKALLAGYTAAMSGASPDEVP